MDAGGTSGGVGFDASAAARLAERRMPLVTSYLDRVTDRRDDDAWLARVWADPATRIVAVADGRVLAERREEGAALRSWSSADAPQGERVLLGLDAAGTAYGAVMLSELPGVPGTFTAGLREAVAQLSERDTAVLVQAVGLENWHRRHPRCPRCGNPTDIVMAGHERRCPRDGSQHHPRTDPAVIMAVVDHDDRLLLGHNARWPDRRFSTLAGFVEPGESLEQAVAREVAEETGIRVERAVYFASQPWPFPASLMLGFFATAATTGVVADGVEIVEARWFTREQLRSDVAAERVLLPPGISIARRLIEHWNGEPLQTAGVGRDG